MEGILSQHGLSSSLWEATFLGEDSWRLCPLLQKEREKRMPPASPPQGTYPCYLGNQWMGNVWKSSTYDRDAVLGSFLPLLERSPQAQFRYPVMRGPCFSGSCSITPPVFDVFPHSTDHYLKFSYSFVWVPVDHWPTRRLYRQKSRICQGTAVTPAPPPPGFATVLAEVGTQSIFVEVHRGLKSSSQQSYKGTCLQRRSQWLKMRSGGWILFLFSLKEPRESLNPVVKVMHHTMVYNNKRLEEPKCLLGYRHLGKRGCLKYLWKNNDALCELIQKDFLNLGFFLS